MGALAIGYRAPARVVGWSLAAGSVLVAATVPLTLAGGVLDRPGADHGAWTGLVLGSAVALVYAVAGGVLVHLRPRNLLGWLLLVTGALHAVSSGATAYGARALTDPDGSLPLGWIASWLGQCAGVPAFLLPTLVLPALYPTGRPPSRLWGWFIGVCLVGTGLLTLAVATVDEVANDAVAGGRLPWDTPEWWTWATAGTSAVLLVPAVAVAVVGTLLRVARARSPERQQLLWLVCVVGLVVATIFLPATEIPFLVTFACIPLAVMVGVTRHRLLGIEVALRRTLFYAPLTVVVALVVGGLTTGVAWLVPEGPIPLVAASAVVAVLVIPVARWLRGLVDRLVLGERADALTLVDRVGAGLEVPSDDPVASMLEAVATAAGASCATVCGTDGRVMATVGEPGGGGLDVPLVHGGAQLGSLVVGPASGRDACDGPRRSARPRAGTAPGGGGGRAAADRGPRS